MAPCPSNVLAAFLIISMPCDSPSHYDPDIVPALRVATVRAGVLDVDYSAFYFRNENEFESDMRFVRRRWFELRDAPPESDVYRLPDRKTLDGWCTFNRQYRSELANRMALELDRITMIAEVIIETDRIYTIIDAARDAQCEWLDRAGRRLALKQLRAAIGNEAYEHMELPPCVPVWRFHIIGE